MTALLCAMLATAQPSICPPVNRPPDLSGWLSQYGEAPTVGTLNYRQAVGDLPANLNLYDGFIAVADCGRIGDLAWLSINGGGWLRVAVFDCAGNDGTPAWMAENQIIAELDYFTARDLGLSGGEPVDLIWGG